MESIYSRRVHDVDQKLQDRTVVSVAIEAARSRRHALVLLGIQPGPVNYRKLSTACSAFGIKEPSPASADRDRTEKLCGTCKERKPIDEFAVKDARSGRRQSNCRACHKGLRRGHYLANQPKIAKQVAARRRETQLRNTRAVLGYLVTHHCVDCGESDPIVLQFDHVRGTKSCNVSSMIYDMAIAEIMKEIEKCDVRCANCHMRRTAAQFGWLRAALAQQVGHLPSKQA